VRGKGEKKSDTSWESVGGIFLLPTNLLNCVLLWGGVGRHRMGSQVLKDHKQPCFILTRIRYRYLRADSAGRKVEKNIRSTH